MSVKTLGKFYGFQENNISKNQKKEAQKKFNIAELKVRKFIDNDGIKKVEFLEFQKIKHLKSLPVEYLEKDCFYLDSYLDSKEEPQNVLVTKQRNVLVKTFYYTGSVITFGAFIRLVEFMKKCGENYIKVCGEKQHKNNIRNKGRDLSKILIYKI